VILPAQPSVSVEVYSLYVSIDGEYTGNFCSLEISVRSAAGVLRLIRRFGGLSAGQSISFEFRDTPWLTLNPGESLVVVHSSGSADNCRLDGLVEYFAA
jgi:hypothetical protein